MGTIASSTHGLAERMTTAVAWPETLAPPRGSPPWLVDVFGPRIRSATLLPWGFHNETWRVQLADGRLLAVSRLVDDGGPRLASTSRETVGRRLTMASVPVPAPIVPWAFESDRVLVTPFIEGTVAAALLSEPSGPRLVGSLAGSIIRRLSTIDPTGLAIPTLWVEPDRLGAAADQWSHRVASVLSARDRGRLDALIRAAVVLLARRPRVLAHGDLAPVNMLVRGGRLSGLIDLEAARVADPLYDAAWFDWLLRFHHPAQRNEAWLGLVEAAGLDVDSRQAAHLRHVLPTLGILERVGTSLRPVAEQPRLLAQLRSILAPRTRVSRV